MSKRPVFEPADDSPRTRGVQQRVRQMLMLERLFSRFPMIARQLQTRYEDRPTLRVEDEFDLHDLLRALLALEHDDIRLISWTPAYSARPRTDFLLKIERTIIVAKLAGAGITSTTLAAQLAIDAEHYRAHPDCQTLVCFVYDPDQRITNPRETENQLNDDRREPAVRVFIAPR